jgi:hypothetical protein
MSCGILNFDAANCMQIFIGLDFDPVSITIDGAGPDLTNQDIKMNIYDGCGNKVLELVEVGSSVLTGIYIPDPTTKTFYPQFRKTETALLEEKTYTHEIIITDENLNEEMFLRGTFVAVNGCSNV